MKPNRCGMNLPEGYACGRKDGHQGPCGEPWKPWRRANFVPAPHFYLLNQACLPLVQAFGHSVYLVGSAIERRDYRDVDVRCILDDAEYDRLFGKDGGYTNAFWSLVCTSVSLYLSQATGLPVDFQIQRQTQANAQHSGKRAALGIFLDYPGERPTEIET